MIFNSAIRLFIALPAICLFVNNTFAQQSFIGLNITTNIDFDILLKPEIGIVFEQKVTNHSGFEVGLNFRTNETLISIHLGNNYEHFSVNEQYVSIPVLYKFYSKILNAGLGVTYDYFIGWRQLSGESYITSYRTSNDYLIGLLGKISKPIRLSEKLVLEPEVKFNYMIKPLGRFYAGAGLVVKYLL